jgi:hypothetical protein
VDPVPDPLLLRTFGSAGKRTRVLWVCSQELWSLDDRRGPSNQYGPKCRTELSIPLGLSEIQHWKLKHLLSPPLPGPIKKIHRPCRIWQAENKHTDAIKIRIVQPGEAVCTATGYNLDDVDVGAGVRMEARFLSNSRCREHFWGPPSLQSNEYLGSMTRGLKRLGREADHSSTTTVDVKNMKIHKTFQYTCCKIWGFHGGDYEECLLLGCDVLWLL